MLGAASLVQDITQRVRAEKEREKLIEQLDQEAPGSGGGLALAKRIVEVPGGRIWVESEGTGQGSTFCLTIPPATKPENGVEA